jgi:6-phosphogluconolactonase
MPGDIKIYKNSDLLIADFARRFKAMVEDAFVSNKIFNILISGGKTSEILFNYFANNYINEIKWQNVHFFWVDERCVPSDHPESNFGTANKLLLKKLNISLSQLHPIVGENHPYLEADRYSTLIHKHFNLFNDIPQFDLTLLGVGTDGHIASIFPNQIDLFFSNRLYEVTTHPGTGQQRISATGKIINNSANIFFIVIGERKAEIIKQILGDTNIENKNKIPALLVNPHHGNSEWFLDQQAASLIKIKGY